MGPERRRQQRGLDAAVGRMLLTAALAAAGGGLVVLPAPGQYRRAASVAAGSLQGTAIVRELWRPGYSFALTLRGGGEKSKEASRKREGEDGDEEGGSREKKRARDENQHRKHTAASEERDQDETTSASDSADELAYDEAAAGGEHGGRVGAHNLGTLPPPIPAKHATLSKGAEGDDTTSESYPGCYSEESSDVVEEPVEARSGPLPTREELIRQIRDRPFNSSFVDDWDRETDERMAEDEAQAMRELEEEAELRKNGTYPVQANSSSVLWRPKRPIKQSDTRKILPEGSGAGGVVGRRGGVGAITRGKGSQRGGAREAARGGQYSQGHRAEGRDSKRDKKRY